MRKTDLSKTLVGLLTRASEVAKGAFSVAVEILLTFSDLNVFEGAKKEQEEAEADPTRLSGLTSLHFLNTNGVAVGELLTKSSRNTKK